MKNACEQAALYFYGELDSAQAAAFEAHLAGCAACRRELQFLQQTQEALVPPAAPQSVVEKVLQRPTAVPFWRRMYKPVLAAALLVGLGLWGVWDRAALGTAAEETPGWLAYVSEELDEEYNTFVTEFEAFENEF